MSSNLLTSPTLRKISVSNSTLLTPLQIKLWATFPLFLIGHFVFIEILVCKNFHRKEVIANPEEQTLVKRLLDDSNSFESRKAKQFVTKFTAQAEKRSKDRKRLTLTMTKRCKSHFFPPSPSHTNDEPEISLTVSYLERPEKDTKDDKKEVKKDTKEDKKGKDKEKDSDTDSHKTLSVREFIAALADHIFEDHHEAHPDLDCDAIEVTMTP